MGLQHSQGGASDFVKDAGNWIDEEGRTIKNLIVLHKQNV